MGKIATMDHFRMADWLVLPTTVGAAPLIVTEAGTTGATHAAAANGNYDLALDNTAEVQNLSLTMGDILRYDIDNLIRVEFLAGITSADMANVTAVLGVGSARNDDPDALAANAYFKLAASLAVVVESDDGTNDNDDKATGETLVTAVMRRFAIDFSRDVQTVSPPGTPKKGKGNVHFYMDDANGFLKRVGSSVLFDMSNYSAGLQIVAQLQKTSATNLATLHVRDIKVEHKLIA